MKRRSFLKYSGLGSSYFLVSLSAPVLADSVALSPVLEFPQGVASGDPSANSVMLWTRAVPMAVSSKTPAKIRLGLQLASDEQFKNIVIETDLHTDVDKDYTVRALVEGLEPDRWYYYRFVDGEGKFSRTGRTHTAPAADSTVSVRFAQVSCQNIEEGDYNAWLKLLQADKALPLDAQCQFVLHLGDFIYEYLLRESDHAVRRVNPFPDGWQGKKYMQAKTLADYRHLYREYLSEPQLQEARARWPFVCTWDDHEFCNDSIQAANLDGDEPAADIERKIAANQAWFEYIPAQLSELNSADQEAQNFEPVKPDSTDIGELGTDGLYTSMGNRQAIDSLVIYRSLQWGNLFEMFISDCRSYRTPPALEDKILEELELTLPPIAMLKTCDLGSAANGGQAPEKLEAGEKQVDNPCRDRVTGSCLGHRQKDWFLRRLQASTAQWKIWASSIPTLPTRLDLSRLTGFGFQDSVFTQDDWMGYPSELREIKQFVKDRGIANFVTLSGDHHMHAAGHMHVDPDEESDSVGIEFSVAGISSETLMHGVYAGAKGAEAFRTMIKTDSDAGTVAVWNLTMLGGARAALSYGMTGFSNVAAWMLNRDINRGLEYIDSDANGYAVVSLTPEKIEVEFTKLAGTDLTDGIASKIRFSCPSWQAGQTPAFAGPVFEGEKTFPYSDDIIEAPSVS